MVYHSRVHIPRYRRVPIFWHRTCRFPVHIRASKERKNELADLIEEIGKRGGPMFSWLTDRLYKAKYYVHPDISVSVVTKTQIFLPHNFFALTHQKKLDMLMKAGVSISQLERGGNGG